MTDEILFTPDKVKELRRAYNAALQQGQSVFVFEGRELLVSYAKYLLEYFDSVFKEGPNQ